MANRNALLTNTDALCEDALSTDELLSIMSALDDNTNFNGITSLEEIRNSLELESSIAHYNQMYNTSSANASNSTHDVLNIIAQNTSNLSRLVNNINTNNSSMGNTTNNHTSTNNSLDNNNTSAMTYMDYNANNVNNTDNSVNTANIDLDRDMVYLQHISDTINDNIVNNNTNTDHDPSIYNNRIRGSEYWDRVDDPGILLIEDTGFSSDFEFEDVIVGLSGPMSQYGKLNNILTTNSNSSTSDVIICRICCPMSPGEDIDEIKAEKWYTLLCGHNICDGCSDHWFSKSKKCPFCRCDLQDMFEANKY